jgi:hypothetical protein
LPKEEFVFAYNCLFDRSLPSPLDYYNFPSQFLQGNGVQSHDRLRDLLVGVFSFSEGRDIILHGPQYPHVDATQVLLKISRVRLEVLPFACDGSTAAQLGSQEAHIQQFRNYPVVFGKGRMRFALFGSNAIA